MICQFCKKNVATVHQTELVEGEKQEVHLCEQCARKKGLSFKSQLSLQDLLSGLMEKKLEKIPDEILAIECPSCGLTFRQFRETGRFGCPRDYQVFQEGLAPLLERIHGSTKHIGKMPKKIDTDAAKERALLDLRSQLEEAVHHEEYERAAELRDRIRKIESAKKSPRKPRKKEDKPAGKEDNATE